MKSWIPPSLSLLLLLSSVSGILSSLAVKFFYVFPYDFSNFSLFYFPGAMFGALVLAPLVTADRHRALRAFAAIVLSTATYYSAVLFALSPFLSSLGMFNFAVAGCYGAAVVTVGSIILLPRKFTITSILLALASGALGGYLIGVFFMDLWMTSGFLVWQCGVALSLMNREPKSIWI